VDEPEPFPDHDLHRSPEYFWKIVSAATKVPSTLIGAFPAGWHPRVGFVLEVRDT
jgi:hypothetical protein